MNTVNLDLVLGENALGLERVLATLRRRKVQLTCCNVARESNKLRVSLAVSAGDFDVVSNLLCRLHDVEVCVPAGTLETTQHFWTQFGSPFE